MADDWDSGRIVRFDHDRGYGFIAPDSGGEDLFVHTNDLNFDKLLARPGLEVRFRAEDSDRGGKASSVELARAGRDTRPAARPTPEPVARQGEGTLAEREFLAEVTELLLSSSPELTAGQVVEIRGQLLRFATQRGWTDAD